MANEPQKTCTHCNGPNSLEASFCSACGEKFAEAADESAEPAIEDETREMDLLEAERLNELGNIEFTQGQYEATRLYQDALALFETWDEKVGMGKVLGNLGTVYRNQGHYERAIEHYELALEIARGIGNKRDEGNWLGNLGNVYQNRGHFERVIEHFELALEIARDLGDKRGEGIWLGSLGNVYNDQGHHERAIEHFELALDIARDIGDKTNEGAWLGNLGGGLTHLGRTDAAEDALRQAIDLCDESYPQAAGSFRASLALLLAKTEVFDEAQTLLEVGASQVETSPKDHALFLAKKGQVCLRAGDEAGARAALSHAKDIAATLDIRPESEVARAITELDALLAGDPDGDDPPTRHAS